MLISPKRLLDKASLRVKFFVAPVIALIAMATLVVLFTYGIVGIKDKQHDIVENDIVIIEGLSEISVEVSQFHSKVYDILLSAKDGADEEAVYEAGKPVIEGLVRLEKVLISARETVEMGLAHWDGFSHIVDDFGLYKNIAITAIEMSMVNPEGAKEQLILADDLFGHLVLDIQTGLKTIGKDVAEDLGEQRELMDDVLRLFILISVAAIIGTFLVSMYLSGALTKEFALLIDAMTGLSNGRRNIDIPVSHSGKEMIVLSDGVASFQQSLEKIDEQRWALEESNQLMRLEIREREKTEADLVETRSRFQYTLDHNPTIIYTARTRGAMLDVMFVSENAKKVIGHEAMDLLGDKRKWLARLEIEDGRFLNKQISELYKKGSLVRDYRIKNSAGDFIWVQDSLTLSYGDEGLVDVLGSLTNITEIKEADEKLQRVNAELFDLASGLEEKVKDRTLELEKANQDLERLSEAKSEFVSIVSHDLRTPLTSIKLFSDIMLDDLDDIDKESQQEYLSIISAETDRLSRLITNVLDFQKISAGKMQWNDDYVDVTEVIRECVRPFKISVEAKGLEFLCECDSGDIKTQIDGDRLAQVVYNLLSNSLKFTEDGYIKVSLKKLRTVDGESIRLSVCDTGPGMEKEQLEKIFEPYEQIQGSVNMGKGTGLGLYITRCVVDRYHGRAWAESVLGEGATFNIELPVRHPESYSI